VVVKKLCVAIFFFVFLSLFYGCSKKEFPILRPNPKKYFDTNLPSTVGVGQSVDFLVHLKNKPTQERFGLRVVSAIENQTGDYGVLVVDGVEFVLSNASPILLQDISKETLSCSVRLLVPGNVKLRFELDSDATIGVDRIVSVRDNQLLHLITLGQTAYPYELKINIKERSYLIGDIVKVETRLMYFENIPGKTSETNVVREFSNAIPLSQMPDLLLEIDRAGQCSVKVVVTLDTSLTASTEFDCTFGNERSPEFTFVPRVNSQDLTAVSAYTTDNQFGYYVNAFSDQDGYITKFYYKINTSYQTSHQTDWILFWEGIGEPQFELPAFPQTNTNGIVVIALKAVDNFGKETIKTHELKIRPALAPDAILQRTSLASIDYIGNLISFSGAASTCESTRTIEHYEWVVNFVDVDGASQRYVFSGSSSEITIPMHAVGTVVLDLAVTDSHGLSGKTSYNLFIQPNAVSLGLYSETQSISLSPTVVYNAYEQDAQRFKHIVSSSDLLRTDFFGIKPVIRYIVRGFINSNTLVPSELGVFPDFYLFSTDAASRVFTLTSSTMLDGVETNLASVDYAISVAGFVPVTARLAQEFPMSLATDSVVTLDATPSTGRNDLSIISYKWKIVGSSTYETETSVPYLTINSSQKLGIGDWIVALTVRDQNNNEDTIQHTVTRVNTAPIFDTNGTFYSITPELPSKKAITLYAPASDIDAVVGDVLRYSYYCYDGNALVNSVENISSSSYVFDFENLSYVDTKTYTAVIVATDSHGASTEKRLEHVLTLAVRYNNTPILSSFKTSYTAPILSDAIQSVVSGTTSQVSITPNSAGTLVLAGMDPDSHAFSYNVKILDFGGHVTKDVDLSDGVVDLAWLVNNKTMIVRLIDQYNAVSEVYSFDMKHYSSLSRTLLQSYTVKAQSLLNEVKTFSAPLSDNTIYTSYFTQTQLSFPVMTDNAAFTDPTIVQKFYIEDPVNGWVLVGECGAGDEFTVDLSSVLSSQSLSSNSEFSLRLELSNGFLAGPHRKEYYFTLKSFSSYDVTGIKFIDALSPDVVFPGANILVPAYENIAPDHSGMGIYRDEPVSFEVIPAFFNSTIPQFGQQNFRLVYTVTHASGVMEGPYTTYNLKTNTLIAKSDFVIHYTLYNDNSYDSISGTIEAVVMPRINSLTFTYDENGEVKHTSSVYSEALPSNITVYVSNASLPINVTITRNLFPTIDYYGFSVTTRLTLSRDAAGLNPVLPSIIDTDVLTFTPLDHPVVGGHYYVIYEMFYTGIVPRYSKKFVASIIVF